MTAQDENAQVINAQVAIDIGGTFTDGVLVLGDSNAIHVAKSLTTPQDPAIAVVEVMNALLAQTQDANIDRVVHGTTLVTNTLVERRGAKAALIVTAGTEDSLDIRRELRYDTYDLQATYPEALVARVDRFGLSARLGPSGEIWRDVDEDELNALIGRLGHNGYDAIAVCLLHAPVNDAHEQFVKAALQGKLPGIPVSLSAEVAREIGEYERMSTAAANAYVQPIVHDYLSSLAQRFNDLNLDTALHIMLSDGAFTTAPLAADAPIRILESGPAGGVLSAVNCARVEGINQVLAFDMGGTTAKACVSVDNRPSLTHVFEFARVQRFKRGSGLPAVAPSIDLIEIGAGGGSLATVNNLGLLQVGPQSAGAEPGPACYARGGTQATVTDADLLLGYLDPENFLGGQMRLDVGAAERALGVAGEPLGLDAHATALGIFDIVNENMAAAARTHIAEQGLDARDFTLVATGGAGPVHAVDVARRLRVSRILCPIASGVGSCLGFLAAPARAIRSWSKVETLANVDKQDFQHRLTQAQEAVVADLEDCGLPPDEIQWQLVAAIRYVGQGNTVNVVVSGPELTPLDIDDVRTRFDEEYRRLYHKTVPGGQPEVVTWRLSGSSQDSARQFGFAHQHEQTSNSSSQTRNLFRPDTRCFEEVPVYARYALAPNTNLTGPLVLTEDESTLIVPIDATVRILPSLSVLIELEANA